MKTKVLLVVMLLCIGGCLGNPQPSAPDNQGHLEATVLSENPDTERIIDYNSSTIPEESNVARAVRVAVATHERVGGGSTETVSLNTTEWAEAESLLNSMNTSYIQYQGYVVEVTIWKEE